MKKFWSLLAVAGLGALACGPVQPPARQDQAGGEAQPRFGGVLTTAMESDPNDWDMRTQGKTGVNAEVHGLAYETLIRFKNGVEADFASQILLPRLAEKWEVSADAKTFTFSLRKGVKWQNLPPVNGREFTAADVKWSVEYYTATGPFAGKLKGVSQNESFFQGLESIQTPDPYTAVLNFNDAYAPFIYYAASQWVPIAAKEVYEQDGHLKDTLIGTGPFIFDKESSRKGTAWIAKKNPDYWNKEGIYLDGIRRLVLPEIATEQAAFQTKQLDVRKILFATDARQSIAANPQASVYKYEQPIGNALLISQRRGGPAADVRIRRAISLGLDRAEHSRVLYGGEATPFAAGAWPGLFTDAEIKEMTRYDPDQARKLIAEAAPKGVDMEMIVTNTDELTQQELIQSQLKKIGVNVKFTVLPREQHRPRLYSGDYDFYRNSGGGLLGPDADTSLFGEFHSKSSLNWSQIKDDELDKLLVNTRREVDPARRREAMRAAAVRINEMAWDPGIVFPANWGLSHPYVKNWRPHFARGEHEAVVWLDK